MSKENHKIEVAVRDAFGNNASRRLRRAGSIPAVVYAKGKENRTFSVNTDAWKVFSATGSQLLTLQCNGEEIPVIVKEVQYNYLKNYVVHIDFQQVDLNAEIKAMVPVHAHGESYGAAHGGILEQDLHELEVVCRPADLPEALRIDVTALNIGDALTVGQIAFPDGVRTNVSEDTLVFHVVRPSEKAETAAAPQADAAAEPEAINEQKTEARAAEKEKK